DGLAPHHLGPALRVPEVHPKQELDDEMKRAAGEPSLAALLDVEYGPRQPARADDTVHAADVLYQLMIGVWWGGPVGIHVADEVGQRSQLEALDQRAAF